MPVQEEFKGIMQTVKERLSSPILGTFVVSWIIVNWDLFYYVICSKSKTSEEIVATINYIHLNYLNISLNYCNLVLAPSIVTILYLYALPVISGWLEGWREIILKWKYNHLATRKALDYDALLKNYNDILRKYNVADEEKIVLKLLLLKILKG